MKKRIGFLITCSLGFLSFFCPDPVLADRNDTNEDIEQLNLQLDQLDQDMIETEDELRYLKNFHVDQDTKHRELEEQFLLLEKEYQALEVEYLSQLDNKAETSSLKSKQKSDVSPAPIKLDGGHLNWPTASRQVTSPFGMRHHPIYRLPRMHQGIDISGGGSILATESGKVSFVGSRGGYGYTILIDHDNGLRTLYAHLVNQSALVSVGDRVNRGQPIGVMGTTGNSTGIHLHFEVHVKNKAVDPLFYLE